MTHRTYIVQGMDCADCARAIERGVRRLEGVRAAQVDFTTCRLQVEGDVSPSAVRARVEALGYALADEAALKADAAASGGVVGFWGYMRSRHETQLALVGGVLIALGLALEKLAHLPVDALYILATLIALYPIARSGLGNLVINRDFNINLLMTVAAIGAIFIGEMLEAAAVILLFAVGEALEGYTADRARHSLRGLLELAPPQATVLRAGREEVVPVEVLQPDDVILVRPGERIPMDGVVVAGSSGVNQAPITGESIPVPKTAGAEVFAGTVNGEGVLEVRVTRRAEDNTLSRIVQLVEDAQSARAPSQRLIDWFARYYTPGVVAIAVLVASVPPLVFGAPFYDTPETRGWLYRALALLVIACPCALVVSTPVTIISAIAAAARRGVLIKGGAHLEALGRVRAFAFDKTGTLTTGNPRVTLARSVDCERDGAPCDQCDDVLALAAAVERRSTHPLAKAVVDAAQARGVGDVYAVAESVKELAGRGVRGVVNGRQVTVGSHSLFDAEHPHSPDLCAQVDATESQGRTAMLLADGERVRGFIAVADEARADSGQVVDALRALGTTTIMLTGDNEAVAQAVGQAVGVDEVRAGLLPADKVGVVKALLAAHGAVVMVGDGVNDTPALAAATVGVAMGGAGNAQAMETADIVLMADGLSQLPYAVRLARLARRLIKQNIALSLGTKLVFMALALVGGASLWLAVFADVGMLLVVTLNGMRPLWQGRPLNVSDGGAK